MQAGYEIIHTKVPMNNEYVIFQSNYHRSNRVVFTSIHERLEKFIADSHDVSIWRVKMLAEKHEDKILKVYECATT